MHPAVLVVVGVVAAVVVVAILRATSLLPAGLFSRWLPSRAASQRRELQRRAAELTRREDLIEGLFAGLQRREARLDNLERELAQREVELARRDALVEEELENLGQLTGEQARAQLLERHDQAVRKSAARLAAAIEDEAREQAEHRARDILVTALQRMADTVAESATTTTIALPDADMKARIIGKEGRNIRAFEDRSGVNLIVDELPDAVLLSSFDPKRREVARAALEGLIADGRIYPSTIEAHVSQAEADVSRIAEKAALDAAAELAVERLSPRVLQALGELHFRNSYGHNVLRHSVETALLAGMMAHELDLDAALLRRAALLHDIGKTRTHHDEGAHARLGAQFLAAEGESAAVCHAVEAHHGDVEPLTVEAVLLQAADRASVARIGSRRDDLAQYLTRLRHIEEICRDFPGVQRAHAMQAGRDIRVMVSPESVNDDQVRDLARRIAERVEREVARPGRLAVTVVRELRATETVR